MNIIINIPNPSGAYQSPESRNVESAPDGYIEITCDYSEFFNGFIIPTIENDIVVSFICNTTAWETWKAEQLAIPISTDVKATALTAIEKATTVASLRNAMLNYIEVSGVN